MVKRITLHLDWDFTNTRAVAPDGTEYRVVGSGGKTTRRVYGAFWRHPDTSPHWQHVPPGTKSTAITTLRNRCRRHAEERQEAARA